MLMLMLMLMLMIHVLQSKRQKAKFVRAGSQQVLSFLGLNNDNNDYDFVITLVTAITE